MNSISVLHINLFQSEKNAPDFYFNTLKDHLVSSHKHIEKPHRHDFYVTVIFTKGTGTHEIDFQKYDVSEGSLFFLSPGQVHSWELSPDTDGYIFFFSQPYYEMHYVNQKLKNFPFFNSPSFPRKLQLQSDELINIIRLFEDIQNEHQSQNVMKQGFILSLISQIYIQSVESLLKMMKKPQQQVCLILNIIRISKTWWKSILLLKNRFLIMLHNSIFQQSILTELPKPLCKKQLLRLLLKE